MSKNGWDLPTLILMQISHFDRTALYVKIVSKDFKIWIQNKANNEATMNQKAKIPFFDKLLLLPSSSPGKTKPTYDLAAARLVKSRQHMGFRGTKLTPKH